MDMEKMAQDIINTIPEQITTIFRKLQTRLRRRPHTNTVMMENPTAIFPSGTTLLKLSVDGLRIIYHNVHKLFTIY